MPNDPKPTSFPTSKKKRRKIIPAVFLIVTIILILSVLWGAGIIGAVIAIPLFMLAVGWGIYMAILRDKDTASFSNQKISHSHTPQSPAKESEIIEGTPINFVREKKEKEMTLVEATEFLKKEPFTDKEMNKYLQTALRYEKDGSLFIHINKNYLVKAAKNPYCQRLALSLFQSDLPERLKFKDDEVEAIYEKSKKRRDTFKSLRPYIQIALLRIKIEKSMNEEVSHLLYKSDPMDEHYRELEAVRLLQEEEHCESELFKPVAKLFLEEEKLSDKALSFYFYTALYYESSLCNSINKGHLINSVLMDTTSEKIKLLFSSKLPENLKLTHEEISMIYKNGLEKASSNSKEKAVKMLGEDEFTTYVKKEIEEYGSKPSSSSSSPSPP